MASPTPSSGAGPSLVQTLPQPFLDKIDAAGRMLDELVKHDPEFAEYCNAAVTSARRMSPTTGNITLKEHHNMKKVVAMENARNLGLNLVYVQEQSPRLLVEYVKMAAETMPKPSTIRFIFPPTAMTVHRSLAEVKLSEAGPCITVFDSYLPAYDLQMQLPKDMLEKEGWKVSQVLPQMQTSNQDCITYALSFALKSFKTKFGEHINDSEKPVLLDIHKRKHIPALFFKHTQDSHIPEHSSELMDKDGQQTLSARIQAYSATRWAINGGEQNVSTSIEGFRLQEIRRVSEAYLKGEKGFDDSLERKFLSQRADARPDVTKTSWV